MNSSKPFQCQEEMRVIKSARTGFWDADLEQHVATCAVCSEAAATARLLNEMRATDEAECRIPDSGLMWWKAQLLAKREAGEHATRPISVVERFAFVLGAVSGVGVCAWQWHTLRDWLISFGTGGVKQGAVFFSNLAAYSGKILEPPILGNSNFFGGSALLVASGAALLLLFVIFGAYLAQSED